MDKLVYIFIIVMSTALLSGCSSTNIRKFNPDPLEVCKVEKRLTNKLAIKRVVMPEGDKDSIMCRMVGNIYLPIKMTYSQYIEDAFKKVLLAADKLSEEQTASNALIVTITKVDFSSTSGRWFINANVKVGKHNPVKINSVTKFGTSWIGESACNNVANAFDEAVGNFVNKVLSNPEIVRNLQS